MAKTITVQAGKFIDATPLAVRPKLVRFVYSTAANHGWEIRVAGQHWGTDRDKNARAVLRKSSGISEEQFNRLMGYKPS